MLVFATGLLCFLQAVDFRDSLDLLGDKAISTSLNDAEEKK